MSDTASSKVLLAAKVEQVQSYLLTSPRLRQIRGGSRLLVQVEHELREILEGEGYGGQVGCAAGGLLLAQLEDSDPDGAAARAERALGEVRLTLARRAPAARFQAATMPRQRQEAGPSGGRGEEEPFGAALRRAVDVVTGGTGQTDGTEVNTASTPAGFGPPPDVPFVLPCDLCRTRPARREVPHGGQRPRACDDCIARFRAGNPKGTGSPPTSALGRIERALRELRVAVKEGDTDKEQRLTVTSLATDRPRGYIGYVAADGNGIGGRLEALAQAGAEIGEYADFSAALDDATVTALVGTEVGTENGTTWHGGAVQTCLRDRPSLQWSKVLPVLAGGDDLLLFTSPAVAVPLAVEFAAAFEVATAADARARGALGTGVGVVIAHASTPFGALDEAAHLLQKRAKALSRSSQDRGSAVAFAVLHASGEVEPEEVRPRYRAGVGCYLLDDCQSLIRLAFKLKDATPPWSRLKQLDALLRRSAGGVEDDLQLLLDVPSMRKAQDVLERAMELPSGSEETETRLWRWDGRRRQYVSSLPDLLALAEIL